MKRLLPFLLFLVLPLAPPACARPHVKTFRKPGKTTIITVERDRKGRPKSITEKVFAAAGQSITITGTRTQPIRMSGQSGFVIQGTGNATLKTGNGTNGIDLTGCSNFQVLNLTITGCNRGVSLYNCANVLFKGVRCLNNGLQGFFSHGNLSGVFQDCEGSGTRSQHGMYLSEQARGVKVINFTAKNNQRSGFQNNTAGSGPSGPVEISGTFAGNNKEGGGQINLLGGGTAAAHVKLGPLTVQGSPSVVITNFDAGRPSFADFVGATKITGAKPKIEKSIVEVKTGGSVTVNGSPWRP
jgi:hypothetical protein